MTYTCCCCERPFEGEPICMTFVTDPKTGKKTRKHALCPTCYVEHDFYENLQNLFDERGKP